MTATPAPRRNGRIVRLLAVLVLLVVALAVAAWLARRVIAREAVTVWLERRGVAAEVRVDRLDGDGMVGAVVLGDPDDPLITVRRLEVDWTLGAPWSPGGVGPKPRRIRLVGPTIRARWTGRRLSFGELDPLIDELARRPPTDDLDGPTILLEDATVRLDSDWGRTTLRGEGRVADGRLVSLDARLPAADYRRGDRRVSGLGGTLSLTTVGPRTRVQLDLAAASAILPGFSGQGLSVSGRGSAAWPDLGARSADGPVSLDLALGAEQVAAADWTARGTTGRLTFVGEARGAGEALALTGLTGLDLRADAADGPLSATAARIEATGARSRLAFDGGRALWRVEGPLTLSAATVAADGWQVRGAVLRSRNLVLGGRGAAMEAAGPVLLTADRFRTGDLSLGTVAARADVDAILDGGLRLGLAGALTAGQGAWPVLGTPVAGDVPELAVMKRALGTFSLSVPAFDLAVDRGATTLSLGAPASVRPRAGGVITVTPGAGAVMVAAPGVAPGGTFALTTRGGGLPEARVAVEAWRLTSGGFQAELTGRALLDFGLARGVTLDVAGRLGAGPAGLTFTAARCTPLTVERLELGENDVTDVAGALCATGGPLVRVADGGWRVDGRLTDLAARAPFLAVRVEDAAGPLAVRGTPAGLSLTAGIGTARVIDATDPARFLPLSATGQARLSDDIWSGVFDLDDQGAPVGRLTLAHDGRTGVGGVEVVSADLVFAEGGRQPSDLTPLGTDLVRSPVSGRARFDGRLDWAPGTGTSGGVVTLDDLDFDSPAGPVEGVSGRIVLTSLAPLETAPGQVLTAGRLATLSDATDLRLSFALDKAALEVGGGELNVAGGRLTLEPLSVPLAPDQPWSGTVGVEGLQIGALLAPAGLGEAVTVDAVVSGRLPFTVAADRSVRVLGGSLYSIQPGRVSIRREALSGLDAAGGGEIPPGTVQDLAYQAMENLAFEELTAAVDSLDAGRLGVRFHILGRHDPPERQELRLTWLEVIRRDFLNRTLPLPSDTGIDLRLDVTLNLDQLLGDLLRVNRARAGERGAEADPDPEQDLEPAR
ncbi:YdbH domain-containing protein [Brevundimonas sp.]|uniref:intermembrane phospholipid transport protein YdbH family protein n=1 Tax=Brevundimonas sp. TaxID=1871086 RepID=UPI00260958BF|nr:YdbH domain-containing protein [Brevundimonas sp.]